MSKAIFFSGFGIAHGKYGISNSEIEKHINIGFIGDFDANRVKNSDDYKSYIKNGGSKSPFDFFATEKMGFETRYHVVPFPPTKARYNHAQNSLDLGVASMKMALENSNIDPEDIDLWLAGCATPHEHAPGIAATIKCHFVGFENQAPAATINSACVGFNINLERAIDYFNNHAEAKHVAIVHTEVMSRLLTNEKSFVPHVTFADAAASVILTRDEVLSGQGISFVLNNEDMQMIDFLGADKHGDLYMNPTKVRIRATNNIVNTVNKLLELTKWKMVDIDMVVPHQTGNAIVKEAAKILNIPDNKLYQDVQYQYGNLSGASVPFGLALMHSEGKLLPNNKIVTAVCGLGGEYGGFTYEVPKLKQNKPKPIKPLKGKTALITGATGGLGSQISHNLAEKGCNLILQYNSNQAKAEHLKAELAKFDIEVTLIQANFESASAIELIHNEVTEDIDFFVHASAITGNLLRASEVTPEEMKLADKVNFNNPMDLAVKLHNKIKDCVIFIGSVAEDAMFSGSSTYVSSKRKLHSSAVSFANMANKKGLRTIYYMIGLLDKGMVDKLNTKQQVTAMNSIGQKSLLNTAEVADRIVRSLYLPKVIGVKHSREGELIVRRDGF